MPNDYSDAPYELARHKRKSPPPGQSINPRDILPQDTQHIDRNVFTPEQAWERTRTSEIKKA